MSSVSADWVTGHVSVEVTVVGIKVKVVVICSVPGTWVRLLCVPLLVEYESDELVDCSGAIQALIEELLWGACQM
jgi:hypothetical protein